MSVPAETYTFGFNYIFIVLSMVLVVPLLIYVVAFVFYENNVSNCYEVRVISVLILYIIYISLILVPGDTLWQVYAKGSNTHICAELVPHAARVYVYTLSGICARYAHFQLPQLYS